MLKSKTLLALTSAFISMNSFALVCQTNMVRGNGSLINSFFGEGTSQSIACRESRKQCRFAIRQGQRNGQFSGADCILIGVVGNGDVGPTPDPVPTPDPNPAPGQFTYELNQIERDYNSGGWRLRRTVIRDLTRFPVARSLKIALTALADSDRDVRNTANQVVNDLLNMINLSYESVEITNIVTPMLNSSSWKVRQQAAVILGKLPSAVGIIPLLSSLADSDYDVRNAVLNSIQKLRNAFDFQDVMRSNKPAVRELSKMNSWKVRQVTAQLIGFSQVSSYVLLAVKLAGDSDTDVRLAAKNAVASITSNYNFPNVGRNLIQKLGELTRASSWNVRQQAVFALGETRNYSARTYVLRALDDSDSDVRNAARIALNKI